MSPAGARVTGWLALAAAPTFALMGLATALQGADQPATMCASGPPGAPFSPMAVMYLLMSGFHAGPWIGLALRLRD